MNSLFEGKRVLCIASSPLQIMGLVSLFSESENKGFIECDLIVNPLFEKAHEVAAGLREEGMFSTVACGRVPMRNEHILFGLRYLMLKAFKQKVLARRFFNAFPSLEGKTYDVLVCSTVYEATLSAKLFCVGSGYAVFIDDGSGSHNGNIFKPFICHDEILDLSTVRLDRTEHIKAAAKHAVKHWSRLDNSFHIEAVYLFAPTAGTVSLYKREVQLLRLNPLSGLGIAKRVLSFEGSSYGYKEAKVLFLSTSSRSSKRLLSEELQVVRLLNSLVGDLLRIRLHPQREKTDFEEFGSCVLSADYLWELLVLEGVISDNMVLVAQGSTAQMTPIMLAGVEPTLIFLYKLLPQEGISVSSIEQSVEDLRRQYKHRERVIVPDSLTALVDAIEAVCCEGTVRG